jgi:hypothetical protein
MRAAFLSLVALSLLATLVFVATRPVTRPGRDEPASIDDHSAAKPRREARPRRLVAGARDAGRREAAVEIEPRDGTADSATLPVRSSAGFELDGIELEAPAGTWTWFPLEAGGIPRELSSQAQGFRAPGHQRTTLADDAAELVLEPDALLVLTASDLDDRLVGIVPFGDPTKTPVDEPETSDEIEALYSCGPIGSDRWAIAVDARAAAERSGGVVPIALWWKSLGAARLELVPRAGMREVWAVPERPSSAERALVVEIRAPAVASSRGIYVTLEQAPEEQGLAALEARELPFGRLVHVPAIREVHQRPLARGATSVDLGLQPVGARARVVADAFASGLRAESVFRFDGRARRLDLQPISYLTFRLAVPEGELDPRWANVLWSRAERAQEDRASSRARSLSAIDGLFRLPLPSRTELGGDASTALELEVRVPGFQVWRRRVPITGADLGTIAIEPLAADLELAWDRRSSVPEVIQMAARDGTRWSSSRFVGRPREGGTIAIAFVRGGQDGNTPCVEQDSRALPASAFDPHSIATVWLGHSWQRRAPDGRFAVVPSSLHAIALSIVEPAGSSDWTFGWEFEGLQVELGRTREPGERDLQLEVPLAGAWFWWSAGDPGQDPLALSRRVPLVEAITRVRVP